MTADHSSEARVFFDRARWPEEAAALESLVAPGLLRVGFDLDHAASGLGAIVNARRKGTPVAALMVYADPLEQLLLYVYSILAHTTDRDAQAMQARGLRDGNLRIKGKTLEEQALPTHSATCAARFALLLADVVFFGTPADKDRLEGIAGAKVRRWALLPQPPPAAEHPSSDVTIYAPSLDAGLASGFAAAVTKRGIKPQVISASNPREAISGATVILPEFWRGFRARTLAARGYRVAVPTESGADAYYNGIATYRMTDQDAIADAVEVLAATTKPTARMAVYSESIATQLATDRDILRDGPLISIIVRSTDRPKYLRRALSSISAQTYAPIEIVLVNNGLLDIPESVLEVVREKNIRHVRPPEPVKLGAALNLGMRAATGTYVGYLDDDDILYPDHCARTVTLLERGGADFCYSKSVGEYARVDANGIKTILGMSVYTDRPYRLDALYEGNLTTIHSVVHRRELFERFGFVDETLPVTEDWELWLRMAVGGARFVHLDRATCEYSWRDDATTPNTSTQRLASFATAYAMVTERYHANVADRAGSILHEQANTLAHLQRRAEAVSLDPSMGLALTMQDLMEFAAQVEGVTD